MENDKENNKDKDKDAKTAGFWDSLPSLFFPLEIQKHPARRPGALL